MTTLENNKTLRVTTQAVNMVKFFEAGWQPGDKELNPKVATSYICPSGKWTDGFGNTTGVVPGQKKTLAQAETQLSANMSKYRQIVINAVKVPIIEEQLGALISLAMNIGEKNFMESSLLKTLNQGLYDQAAAMFSLYNKGRVWSKKHQRRIKTVLPGLVKRRTAEAVLFAEGTKRMMQLAFWQNPFGFVKSASPDNLQTRQPLRVEPLQRDILKPTVQIIHPTLPQLAPKA